MIRHIDTNRGARPAGYLVPGATGSPLPARRSERSAAATTDTYVNPSAGARPNTIPHHPRGRFFVGLVLLVCCVALVVAIWETFFRYKAHGLVAGQVVEVAAGNAGVVTRVHVNAGQRVERGDPLFEIDSLTLQQSREELLEQITVARAELASQEVHLTWRRAAQSERYLEAVAEYHALSADLLTDRAQLNGLRAELPLKREMRSRGIPELTVEKLEIEMAGQAEHVDEMAIALERMKERVAAADGLMDEGLDSLEPYRARIDLLEGRLERLDARLAGFAVRSPVDGVVVELMHDVGEYCGPSDALLSVLDRDTICVQMYLRQEEAGMLEVGDPVDVVTEPDDHQLSCRVDRVDFQLVPAPQSIERHYRAKEVLLAVYLRPDWEDEGWQRARLHQTVMLERISSEDADDAVRAVKGLLTATQGAARATAGK